MPSNYGIPHVLSYENTHKGVPRAIRHERQLQRHSVVRIDLTRWHYDESRTDAHEEDLALDYRRCRPGDRLRPLPLAVKDPLERHAGCGTGNREGEAAMSAIR